MSADKLVRMANQIAVAFRMEGEEAAVKDTAEHIRAFWSPVMRRDIYAHLDAGGAGLEPIARAALERLRRSDRAAAAPSG